ncbi:MAG: tRNA-dihydrouridine synthase family protein [Patescibacteria group bacterium]|jgi:nifR3 family TIM-barrel protein
MNNIWTRKNPHNPLLVLSPMAGYTDSAFRILCKGYGADVVMTELVSADAIAYGKFKVHKVGKVHKVEGKNHSTAELLSFYDDERPIVVQLFGKYPEKFAYAAKWVVENLKPDGIDINMGCPARKVIGSDHGAALLKNPDLACEIVRAVRAEISIPLSVKTRLGWENDNEILDFAPRLAEAGADAIIIHGRTYKDGFKNIARWENIYQIKDQISKIKNKEVSIIGNGDISNYDEAIKRSESGGIKLDGVAIGRATFGKPWIFSAELAVNSLKPTALILKHAKLVYETKGDHGIIEFRKHLLAYLRGFQNAKEMRKQAASIKSIRDIEKIINMIKND